MVSLDWIALLVALLNHIAPASASEDGWEDKSSPSMQRSYAKSYAKTHGQLPTPEGGLAGRSGFFFLLVVDVGGECRIKQRSFLGVYCTLGAEGTTYLECLWNTYPSQQRTVSMGKFPTGRLVS